MSGFMSTYGLATVFSAIGIYNIVTCVAAFFRTGDSHYWIGAVVGFLWIGGGVFFAVRGRRRRARDG